MIREAFGRAFSIYHHIVIFILTFFGYAFFHATRKSFSNVKTTISEEWTPVFCNETLNKTYPDSIWNSHHLFENGDKAEYFLGALDTAFLFAYAVGLYISGFLEDRFDLRKVLAFGMCSSAICVFMFGCVSEWLHIYSIPYYLIFWILNGLFQSTGWPAMVTTMGNWFGKSSRGLVLGVWSACASVGNIIGALMASAVVDYGYEYVFLVPAVSLFCWGVLIFFALVSSPTELGLPDPNEPSILSTTTSSSYTTIQADGSSQITDDAVPLLTEQDNSESVLETQVTPSQKKLALSFWRAILLPGVAMYSLAYACLKLVNYAFFFWLPFYLSNAYGWSNKEADKLSIYYDVGGIVAGIIGGFISDRLMKRSPVLVVMLILALPSLYIYSILPGKVVMNAIVMAIAGGFVGGPANLISSAISADLGRQKGIFQNQEALASVTGIVDGTGSIGAAIGQVLIPVIQQAWGWHYVFYLFLLMTLLTIVCVLPIMVKELGIGCSGCCSRFHSPPSQYSADVTTEPHHEDD